MRNNVLGRSKVNEPNSYFLAFYLWFGSSILCHVILLFFHLNNAQHGNLSAIQIWYIMWIIYQTLNFHVTVGKSQPKPHKRFTRWFFAVFLLILWGRSIRRSKRKKQHTNAIVLIIHENMLHIKLSNQEPFGKWVLNIQTKYTTRHWNHVLD